MRIAVIGPTFPYRGGISHFSTVLTEELRKQHDVHFLSWKRLYPPFLYPSEQRDTVSQRRITTPADPILDYVNPFSWYRTVRRIREMVPDVVLIHWWHPVMAPVYRFLTFFIHRQTTAKIIFICHNVLPHEGFPGSSALTRFALKSGNAFIVHNEENQKQLYRLKPGAQVQIAFHPIYNVFVESARPSSPIEEKLILRSKRILFFGIVRPYKGIQHLLDAMPRIIQRHDVDLLIVGQFWKGKEALLQQIERLGIADHVKIIDNYIRNEHVRKYFDACDLAIIPYISGTQSGIIQTAYAFNRPVVATRVGGFSEAVQDGVTGYLIPPGDAEALADAVIRFYDNDEKECFIENVRAYKERFSWRYYVEAIEQLAR